MTGRHANLRSMCRETILHKMRTAGTLLVVAVCLLNVALSMKICAFNVQSFGESKVNNKKVLGILLKVLTYYMIQTARSSSASSSYYDYDSDY